MKIYVEKLDSSIDNEKLNQMFSVYGEVKKAVIMANVEIQKKLIKMKRPFIYYKSLTF